MKTGKEGVLEGEGPSPVSESPRPSLMPTALELLALMGLCFGTWHYFWVLDDAYIYFRYAENYLSLGWGLVFNPGEFVEGFSSPAWMLWLLFLRSLKVSYPAILLGTGLFAACSFWSLSVWAHRRMLEPACRPWSINLPLLYLSFHYGVLCYFSSGLESPFVLLSAAIYVALAVAPSSGWLQILFGLAPLVRPELTLAVFLFIAWHWIWNRSLALPLIISCLLTSGSYLFFRIFYYAQLLPNTFYLKDTSWWSQGLLYLWDAWLPYETIPLLCLGLLGMWALENTGKRDAWMAQRVLLGLTGFCSLLYVVRIGGDARHMRYLLFPTALFVFAGGGILESLMGASRLQSFRRPLLGAGICFALVTGLCYPRQLQHHPALLVDEGIHERRFHHLIADASAHRFRGLRESDKTEDFPDLSEALNTWNAKGGRSASPLVLNECFDAYLNFSHPIIQGFGLTEPFLARFNVPAERPAHKPRLHRYAIQLLKIRRVVGFRPGVFSAIVEQEQTPPWIPKNLATLEAIERRVYNRHDFWENLGLALEQVGRIEP